MAQLSAPAKKKSLYRVAVIGCGKIGALFEAEPKREKPASHAGTVMAHDRTELAALVDTNTKNLTAARKLFPRAASYTSLTECLKSEQLDVVIIATPPAARLALLKECARFGIPMVVCEKPLARNVKEAKQMEAIVAKSGMTFVLNYQRRFSPLFARLRSDIKKIKLGKIQQVTCYYSNGLHSNGGHIINSLLYVLGDDIVSAVGFENAMNKTHPTGDPNRDALLTTKKGAKIVLQSLDQKEYGIHDIRIFGTKGSVVLTDYGMTLIETPARPSRFAEVRQLDASKERSVHKPLSATKDALAEVIDCYEKRRVPESSAGSGVATLKVLDALSKSAKSGGKEIAVR